MAGFGPYGRSDVNIRAKINTLEESDDHIKTQLKNANQAQQAIRSRSTWSSNYTRHEVTETFQKAHAAFRRKAGSLRSRSKSVSRPKSIKHECHDLPENADLNTRSTLQYEVEATGLTRWDDSPVSPLGPSTLDNYRYGDHKPPIEDPCPPIRVYTIKQARKDDKKLQKSLKQKDKQRKKLEEEESHSGGEKLGAEAAAVWKKDATTHVPQIDRSGFDLQSVNGSKASKEARGKLSKPLKFKQPLLKLARSSKKTKQLKLISEYIDEKPKYNSSNQTSSKKEFNIAELPAPPISDKLKNEYLGGGSAYKDEKTTDWVNERASQRNNESSAPRSSTIIKTMRCQVCQFGINPDQIYYHCTICNNGARIVCEPCEAAGLSCCHDLTYKMRKIARSRSPSPLTLDRSSHFPWEQSPRVNMGNGGHSIQPFSYSDDYGGVSHLTSNNNTHDVYNADAIDHLTNRLREVEIKTQERHIAARERELRMLDRWSASQDRQERMAERMAERASKLYEQMQMKMTQQQIEFESRIGTQFTPHQNDMYRWLGNPQNHGESARCEINGVDSSLPAADEFLGPCRTEHQSEQSFEYDLGESYVRTHVSKRKTEKAAGSGKTSITSSRKEAQSSRKGHQKAPEKNDYDDEEDEDDDRSGNRKRLKKDPEDASTEEVLWACPFNKHKSERYSARNIEEKHYRGCATGIWTTISRLKQHLYRVHQQPLFYCGKCFETFESDEDVDHHCQRLDPCHKRPCPFEEKFGIEKAVLIRQKAPKQDHRVLWYQIYSILFPDAPRPQNPYSDFSPNQHWATNSPVTFANEISTMFVNLFESCLENRQNELPESQQIKPELREFLTASINETRTLLLERLSQNIGPQNLVNPADVSPQSVHNSAVGSLAQGSSLLTTPSSIPTSPTPLSASSTRSSMSWHRQISSRSHSFSRPFPARPINPARSNITASIQGQVQLTGSNKISLNHHIVNNPENDVYDEESSSWQKGDESRSLGLAVTTDDLNSNFSSNASFSAPAQAVGFPQQPTNAQLFAQLNPGQYGSTQPGMSSNFMAINRPPHHSQERLLPSQMVFNMGNTSLATSSNTTGLKAHPSNASNDSGYSSMPSRQSTITKSRPPPPRFFSNVKQEDFDGQTQLSQGFKYNYQLDSSNITNYDQRFNTRSSSFTNPTFQSTQLSNHRQIDDDFSSDTFFNTDNNNTTTNTQIQRYGIVDDIDFPDIYNENFSSTPNQLPIGLYGTLSFNGIGAGGGSGGNHNNDLSHQPSSSNSTTFNQNGLP